MNIELSKRLKAMVRKLADTAHEREMRALIEPVSESVGQWKSGKKDTWPLLEDLDRFNHLRHRLTDRYRTNSIAPMLVACAIVSGILRKSEVSPELLQALQKPIEFYKRGIADGTISLNEEEE